MTRALLAIAGLGLLVQEPRLRRVGPVEAEFPEGFTRVSAVRELADGRVLIADTRDKTVQLLDFTSGKATPVGREGAGPGEYGIPATLIALPGDTTLLFDPINARLLVILPDAKPGPLFRVPEALSPSTMGGPRASDARGRLYYEVQRRPEPGAKYGPSETDVVRFDRTTGRIDTIATLQLPKDHFSGARMLSGGMLQAFTNKPLHPYDIAAYATDGRVAIARGASYQIEWLSADGKRTATATIPYQRIRITEAERKAFLESQTRPGAIIVRGGPGAAPPAGGGPVPRAAPLPADPFASEPVDWPDYKPPFLSSAASIDPSGRLWVLKTRAHDDKVPVYDVIDGNGKLVERVALPPSTRLAGFGRGGALYLVRNDADDLQWLGRYKL